MAARAPILAGKTVILLQLQDNIDSALASVKKRINKFSNSLNKISFELFTGGLAGSLIPARSLKDFKDLEDRLLFLSTKLEVTDEQMLTVTNRIRDLGRTTSFTANEVADGAAVLAQAGLNATQVMDTLGATLDLARGNAITLEQSGAILANTMTVFGIAGSKAGEVASQFTRAARLGTLDVLDLKESLKEVVGTLDNLNIDLPTSLALVTQLAQSSLKGTKAGTSLNTALLQLASKKDVLRNTLGIGIEDAQGNLRPIIDILDDLLVRLSKMGDVARLATIQRIFNIRGGRAVQGLLRDLANVRALAKDIRTAGNEAQEAAIKMDSGFGGATRKTINSLLSLSFTIGKINEQIAGPFLRVIPALTAEIEKLAVANPGLVLTLSAIPPALVAVGATGLVASFALNKLGGLIGGIGLGFQTAASIINKQFTNALVGALAVQRKIGKTLGSADTGLSALLLTPQRVGGRGRGANKIKPTSFFGRVGNTKVPVIASLVNRFKLVRKLIDNLGGAIDKFANKSDAAIKRLFVSFTKLRVLNSGRGAGVISRLGDNALIGRTGLLQARSQRKALESSLASQTAAYKKSIAVEREARASAKVLTASITDSNAAYARQAALKSQALKIDLELAKVGTILRRSQTASAELATLDTQFAEVLARKTNGRTAKLRRRQELEAVGRARAAAKRAVFSQETIALAQARSAALSAKRTAILAQVGSDAPNVLGLTNKAGIQAGLAESEKARRVALAASIRGTKKNLEVAKGVEVAAVGTKRAAVLTLEDKLRKREAAKVRLATRRSAKIDATLFKGAGTLDRVFRTLTGGGLKLITGGFKGLFTVIKKIDIVRILFNVAKAGYSVLKVIGGIGAVTFKTLTTLSGWGNILTFLLIFGPHIKFIREAFERLGNGIANAFSELTKLGTLLGPVFSVITSGFKSIIAGEGGLGINQLTEGFSLMVNIVGIQLTQAWNHLTLAISPAYDFMVKMIKSAGVLVGLFGNLLGQSFGGLFSGLDKAISGDGQGSIIERIFKSIDFEGVFRELSIWLAGIASVINTTLQGMYNVIAETMLAIQIGLTKFLAGLPDFFFGDAGKNAAIDVAGIRIVDGKLVATNVMNLRAAINETNKTFNDFPNKMQEGLDKAFKSLKDIFRVGGFKPDPAAIAQGQLFGSVDQTNAAANAAAKREQQRTVKGLGRFEPTGILPGSIDNKDKTVQLEKERLLAQQKELRFRISQQRGIIGSTKLGSLTTANSVDSWFKDKGNLDQAKESLKEFKDKLKLNKTDLLTLRQKALGNTTLPQTVDIRDLVSLAVGDIQSTRLNKFKVSDTDPARQQVDLLQQINSQLGPTTNDSYLKKLTEKAGPLTFTK